MIIREMKLDTSDRPNPNFKDIDSKYRFYNEIAAAVDEGIIDGFTDGTFGPNEEMTRSQMAKILVGAYKLKLQESKSISFKDVPAVHWAHDFIKILASNGITEGYNDGTFNPSGNLNRLHFSLFLSRYINDVKDKKQDDKTNDLAKEFELKADKTKVSYGESVSLNIENKTELDYKADWKTSGGKLTVADDGKKATWKAENNSTKDYTVTVTIEVTPKSSKKVTFDKSITISVTSTGGSSGGGGGGGGAPKPETPVIPVSITVNEVEEDTTTYTTQEEKVTLTGKIEGTGPIQTITATYQPVASEAATEINVEGLLEWSIKDIPLEIGTNNVKIEVKTKDNKTIVQDVVINRVNNEIEFNEKVTAFNSEDEEDMQVINDIANSIENYWIDDMGTPDDSTDDITVLLVKEESPLVKDLKTETLKSGDIVSIPPNVQFLAGWTFMIQDYGEPSDFYNYPSHLYEEIYVVTPGFADMFQGDISLDFSGYIDPEDPIAFSLFPEGVEIIATDETGQETVLVEDAMQSLMF